MSKQYYCEMDKSVFSTEEELIKHIKNNYVQVLEGKGHEVSDLHSKLKHDFPDYEISIEDGKGWYAEYIIRLTKNNGIIEQSYGNEGGRLNNPDNYKLLKVQIEAKIRISNGILSKVNEKYNFEEFEFSSYEYGYGENEHRYEFRYKVNKNDAYEHDYFYPYNTSVDDFVKSLEQYFVTVLEGEPKPVRVGGYFIGYSINGIDIGVMMGNKKVRLEIIE
jgi:hypothetical protein